MKVGLGEEAREEVVKSRVLIDEPSKGGKRRVVSLGYI